MFIEKYLPKARFFCSICFYVLLLDFSILLKTRNDELFHESIIFHEGYSLDRIKMTEWIWP